MQFEVEKKPGAKPRWRWRDAETGRVVPLKLGRVHLPPTTEENRRVQKAVDAVLSKMAATRGNGLEN